MVSIVWRSILTWGELIPKGFFNIKIKGVNNMFTLIAASFQLACLFLCTIGWCIALTALSGALFALISKGVMWVYGKFVKKEDNNLDEEVDEVIEAAEDIDNVNESEEAEDTETIKEGMFKGMKKGMDFNEFANHMLNGGLSDLLGGVNKTPSKA